jgi:hypothetical protein
LNNKISGVEVCNVTQIIPKPSTPAISFTLPEYHHLRAETRWIDLYLLIPHSSILLEKIAGFQLVKKSPHFMEPAGSSPHSQVLAKYPHPEPA